MLKLIQGDYMKTIVLCSSMKFKDQLIETKNRLEKMSYKVELPLECMAGESKIIASRAHFDRIANKNTDAIIVINCDKENIKNYIGPNSFAEIAFAFYFHKKVFLLQDIYPPYEDELLGWQATALKNNLENIKRYL